MMPSFSAMEMKTARLTSDDPPIVRTMEIAAELEALAERSQTLSREQRAIAEAEAQKIADLAVGQEVDCEYGYKRKIKRYRVTKVGGHLTEIYGAPGQWFVSVNYRGVLLKKDGTEGAESGLFHVVKVHDAKEQETNGRVGIRGDGNETNQ